ncbi:MAG: glycoside hydrolase family 13 protein [Elusimicrobiales bacterium]|nr:glycoside hydrolase family 13 protein [Elusimicrobiales bacterium]
MEHLNWVKGAVIYQIFPDRFARSKTARVYGVFEKWDSPETRDGFKGGNLKGAEEKLDYLRGLGVNAVYFTPIFSSAANHRYHTFDYYSVDPVLGGNPALKSFLKAAHKRGIKVILDGVFNHASRGFFQFNHLLENGAASPYKKWFHPHGYPLKAYNLKKGEKPNYSCWWGLPALPKFNTKNPEVRNFILGVAKYWLEQGIDGWRLDVPYEINDDSFWREFRRVCKAVNPDCYITGEIWGEAKRWLKGDQFDAVMNYQLSAACISYFGGKKLKLTHSYAGKKLKHCGQAAFIRGIESLLGQYKPETTLRQMNMMSSHDTDRMLSTYGGDETRMRLAVVFSFLFPGAINIYYGEELGLEGAFNAGTRRGMPWSDKSSWNKDLLALYKRLAALREASPAIKDGKFEFIKEHCDGEVLAFRRFAATGSLVCLMNSGASAKELELKPGALGKKPGAAINSGVTLKHSGGKITARLAPGACAVYLI